MCVLYFESIAAQGVERFLRLLVVLEAVACLGEQ